MSNSERLRRFLAPGPYSPGQVVTLTPDQSRHMVTVLRIGAGRRIRVFTGQGDEFAALVEDASPTAARVRIVEKCPPQPSAVRLTLAFAPPPGQRADILIEKATELGADALQPILCERLQGFQTAAAARRTERWRRKAQDAARQSGRTLVPEVHAPQRIEDFVRRSSEGLRLIASPGGSGLWGFLAGIREVPGSVTMAVGPAGGLASAELDLAEQAGFRAVSLGPRILRAETAAICLLASVVLWLEASPEQAPFPPRSSSPRDAHPV
jgi:16S rRNA (uracil1498-N3)-methyltransferase